MICDWDQHNKANTFLGSGRELNITPFKPQVSEYFTFYLGGIFRSNVREQLDYTMANVDQTPWFDTIEYGNSCQLSLKCGLEELIRHWNPALNYARCLNYFKLGGVIFQCDKRGAVKVPLFGPNEPKKAAKDDKSGWNDLVTPQSVPRVTTLDRYWLYVA